MLPTGNRQGYLILSRKYWRLHDSNNSFRMAIKKTNLRGMEALAVLVEDSGSVSSTY